MTEDEISQAIQKHMTRLVLDEGADADLVLSQTLAVCIKLIAGRHGDSIAA